MVPHTHNTRSYHRYADGRTAAKIKSTCCCSPFRVKAVMLLTWTRRELELELWMDTSGNQTLLDKQTEWRLFGWVLWSVKNKASSIDWVIGVFTGTPLRLCQNKERWCVSIRDVFLDPLKTPIWSQWSLSKVQRVLKAEWEGLLGCKQYIQSWPLLASSTMHAYDLETGCYIFTSGAQHNKKIQADTDTATHLGHKRWLRGIFLFESIHCFF